MKSTLLPLLITLLALAAACSPAENKTEPAASGEMTTQSQKEHTEHDASSTTTESAKKPVGKIMFVTPQDGATVKSPFKVEMGIEGMTVMPAGEMKEHTGHHHLIIDGPAIASGEVVPKDETHMHFGKGQTSTEVTLKPGKHTLTLQFADGAHKSYGPDMSSTINVTVE